MANDPAFLFYPGDWLGGTMTLTRQEKGAYMDLLIAQFNQVALTIEDIQGILGNDFSMWDRKLKYKFEIEGDGLYFNRRLRMETIKRKEFTESRRSNLSKTPTHMQKHMPKHMENENENRNRNKDINKDIKDEGYGEKEKQGLFATIYARYPKKDSSKEAWLAFQASVNSPKDWADINKALDNYMETKEVKDDYIKSAKNWFNGWRDFIENAVFNQDPAAKWRTEKR